MKKIRKDFSTKNKFHTTKSGKGSSSNKIENIDNLK